MQQNKKDSGPAVAVKAAKIRCPKCGCTWSRADGVVPTHGPGPAGEFICPGSADRGMVEAGKLHV